MPWPLHLVPLVLGAAASSLSTLGWRWLVVAVIVGTLLALHTSLVVVAEARFGAWVRGNDGRAVLEGLLPPRQHHPMFLSSGSAQEASRVLATTARPAVEE